MPATRTTPAEPVIEMAGVSVGTIADPDRVVVEDIEWVVREREMWVIAGMHGSGKADLLNLIAGVLPPKTGEYRLFGHRMPMYSPDQLADRLKLATVFENGGLLHQLTVRDNVALPLRYHSDAPEAELERAVDSMMELLELGPQANMLPGALPRYVARRAGLCRALMLKPRALLLANPLGGLDPRNAAWWLNMLAQLSRGELFMPGNPVTIIATSDELRPWRNAGCHVALLDEKKFLNLGYCPDFGRVDQPLLKEFMLEEAFHNKE